MRVFKEGLSHFDVKTPVTAGSSNKDPFSNLDLKRLISVKIHPVKIASPQGIQDTTQAIAAHPSKRAVGILNDHFNLTQVTTTNRQNTVGPNTPVPVTELCDELRT
jgi:hypothetical protein